MAILDFLKFLRQFHAVKPFDFTSHRSLSRFRPYFVRGRLCALILTLASDDLTMMTVLDRRGRSN